VAAEKFSIVLADPPWEYGDKRTGGTFKSGSAQVYANTDGADGGTLSLAELRAIPLPSILAPNGAAFLWTTTPLKFSHGYPLLEAWGYRYVTTIYWRKTGRLGMGRWFRGQYEELLVGVRGELTPFGCQERNEIGHPAKWRDPAGPDGWSQHSQKPEEFRRLIERATGEASSRRNLELFARRNVAGWTCLGFEIDGLDIREAVKRQAVRIWRSAGAAAGAAAGEAVAEEVQRGEGISRI
jgi:N6-adenosine-specific RNA methylase IME4